MKSAAARVGDNLLEASGLPLFFEVGNPGSLGLEPPINRHGQSVRVWARSLTTMQKEAVVLAARSGRAWRLASDEGPYLQGHDFGPCPLSFLSTGMVASYFNEITALAAQRDVTVRDLELAQHNFYAMEGSALRGTMTGSAMEPALEVRIDCDADDAALRALLDEAMHASPLDGLLRRAHTSLFTLSHNGRDIPTGRAQALGRPAPAAPRALFNALEPAGEDDPGWIRKVWDIADADQPDAGAGSSLKAEQKRSLHLLVTCRQRGDGVKEITQEMFQPAGSSFRYLSDESREFGGASRAPDAVSYMAAGIAFCFMTQLGRYAKILKKNLVTYDIVQDTHFSVGGASGDNDRKGIADPVETHLYLGSSEDDDFARSCLDMGEQTCFLHALCRTPLQTRVTIERTG